MHPASQIPYPYAQTSCRGQQQRSQLLRVVPFQPSRSASWSEGHPDVSNRHRVVSSPGHGAHLRYGNSDNSQRHNSTEHPIQPESRILPLPASTTATPSHYPTPPNRLPSFSEAFRDIAPPPSHSSPHQGHPVRPYTQKGSFSPHISRTSPIPFTAPRLPHPTIVPRSQHQEPPAENDDLQGPDILEIRNFCTNTQLGLYDYRRMYTYYKDLEQQMRGKIKKDFLNSSSNTKRYHRIQLICKRIDHLVQQSGGDLDRAIEMFKAEKGDTSLTAYTRELVAVNKDVKLRGQQQRGTVAHRYDPYSRL